MGKCTFPRQYRQSPKRLTPDQGRRAACGGASRGRAWRAAFAATLLLAWGGAAGCASAPAIEPHTPSHTPSRAEPPPQPGPTQQESQVGSQAGSQVGSQAEPQTQARGTKQPPSQARPEHLARLESESDFRLLAAEQASSDVPDSLSVKTVIDRVDGNALYFQNSSEYPLHFDFVSANLSGGGLPLVPLLAAFNATEYASPSRRFLLGAITYYEALDAFVYEIAPYDSATAGMIADSLETVSAGIGFLEQVAFHPTSTAVARIAQQLPPTVSLVTSDEIYADTEFQILNQATSYGHLRLVPDDDLDDFVLSHRDIAVFENVPDDVGVLMGIITEEFQTPLSHVNVLSRNRGTPNLALRDALERGEIRALDGEWVRFDVGPSSYTITAVPKSEADLWWDERRPDTVRVPVADLTVTDLRDVADVVDLSSLPLAESIEAATRAFGGKAAHYAVLANIADLPIRPAFAVPVAEYFQFMERNELDAYVADMLADPTFQDDPLVRAERLSQLRDAIRDAPLVEALESRLVAKLRTEYPATSMRFRSSTNAEDLGDYTGAGLYDSKTAYVGDPDASVADAVRKVWASVWSLRAFEEREYRGIDHLAVGMGLLVHESFPDEEANGVALTNDPYDRSGLDPAFYINVQVGETSVVTPPAGTTADTFLLYYDHPNQPTRFVSRSSETEDGEPVLTEAQVLELGRALATIRDAFAPVYAPRNAGDLAWWAMDVEFKFDAEPGETPLLYVKQARPYR